MYNTDIIKILTLCVQMALPLRQDLNIIVSLASIGQPNMILYNPIFALFLENVHLLTFSFSCDLKGDIKSKRIIKKAASEAMCATPKIAKCVF